MRREWLKVRIRLNFFAAADSGVTTVHGHAGPGTGRVTVMPFEMSGSCPAVSNRRVLSIEKGPCLDVGMSGR